MNILVTGSAGFIGANLVKRLLKDMTEGTLIGLDNLKLLRRLPQRVPPKGTRYLLLSTNQLSTASQLSTLNSQL